MKLYNLTIILVICHLLSLENAFAQKDKDYVQAAFIEPYHLSITNNKTTNLIFPFPIKSVDRGSENVLVQKAKGIDNILQVKASQPNFEQTNLTVITANESFFSFVVDYSKEPDHLNLTFSKNIPAKGISSKYYYQGEPYNLNHEAYLNEVDLRHAIGVQVLKGPLFSSPWRRQIRDKVILELNEVYANEKAMFYRMVLKNYSHINYDIDMFRFYIRDKKHRRRSAVQEIEIKPFFVLGNSSTINFGAKETYVLALKKFTLPPTKYLAIEIKEKDGVRDLALKVSNHDIINAQVIPVN